jgi:ferredoxin
VRVLAEGGRITGLEVREVLSVFDGAGLFAPRYADGACSVLEGGTVIFAVGQEAASDLWREEDPRSGMFACGEIAAGPGSAIEAVADAQRCARRVMGFLRRGRASETPAEALDKVDDLPEDVLAKIRPMERTPIRVIEPDARRTTFEPFEIGFSEAEAVREAWRCLACAAGADVDQAKCAACLACARICPFGVPSVDGGAVMRSEQCQSCGLCAVECPAGAIAVERLSGLDLAVRIADVLGGLSASVDRVEIVCARDAESREALTDCVVELGGERVARFPVSCAALADEVAMMKPFEFGVRDVSVIACRECCFEGAEPRLARRVERVRSLLAEAGVAGAGLTFRVPQPAEEVGA